MSAGFVSLRLTDTCVMGLILFVLLLGVPIAELYVIVQVAQGVGVLETLVLLLGVSIAGAWLLKREGLATLRRLQETIARGEIPSKEITDGALILFGGALLLTPGFLTDAVGLALLIPPARALVKGAARRMLGRAAKRRSVVWHAGSDVYDTTAQRRADPDATTRAPLPSPKETPPSAPSPRPPRDEDGSPDSR
jgi:UPF0716 protein FxsA